MRATGWRIEGGAPGYRQIAEQFAARIRTGDLAVGTRLPSERELADDLGVSRVTVSQAMRLLRERGLVDRRQGDGTYVAFPTLTFRAERFTRFSDQLRLKGLEPGARTEECGLVPAPAWVADALGLPLGTQVVRMLRVRSGNGVPLMLDLCFHPHDRFPDLGETEPTRDHGRTISDRYGVRLGLVQQTITPLVADDEQAELLSVAKGSALLQVQWVGFDFEDRPWGCGFEVYAGAAASFSVEGFEGDA